ncbi:MAG: hypothetical protein ABWW66_03905 [Archaeoglobaceae archaeon]
MIANLLLAEVAAYLTFLNYSASQLRYFLPNGAEIILFIAPIAGIAVKKPFSFYYYLLLLFFNSQPILATSETFEGLLDTLKALDAMLHTGAIAEQLLALREPASFDGIVAVTFLYSLSEVLDSQLTSLRNSKLNGVEIEGEHLPLAIAVLLAVIALVVYFAIPSIDFAATPVLLAVAAAFLFVAAAYLAAKEFEG